MADFEMYDEVKVRRVYRLNTPTNWVEVQKVLADISMDSDLKNVETDDAVLVESDGESIRFSYPLDK